MSKTSTQYDYKSVYYVHEQALDHIVRMVGHLLHYVRANNDQFFLTEKGALIHLQPHENEVIYSDSLYDKLMKENFSFNSYKSLKRLLAFACYQNEVLSSILLLNILRNLSYGLDNCVSYLEALREIMYIKDEFVAFRRELVFGVPTTLDEVDFQRNLKFGFQVNKNLERQSINYISAFKVTSGIPTFLKCIIDVSEKSESNCYIMIVFLLQMINADQSLFLQLVSYPSPCHMFENLHQWIFWFIKTYTDREHKGYESVMNQYKASKLFASQMKENLTLFEDHIENYVRVHHQAESEEMSAVPFKCQDIFAEGDRTTDLNREVYCTSRLLPLGYNPIVGSVVAEENQNDFKIAEDNNGQLVLRVIELRTRLADSISTGQTNLAIPQAAYTGSRIYEQDVPKNTLLHKFFDFENQYSSSKRPVYPGEKTEVTSSSLKSKIDYAEGIQVISEDQVGERRDSEDDVSFGDKESWRQGVNSKFDSALLSQMNAMSFRETHYILK